jgi:benzil reductase ((S)-benzoin forming)
MNHYFITGTSRGLGQALARRLLGPENALFCFSRSPNPQLSRQAETSGWTLHYRTVDLTDLQRITPLLEECFGLVDSPSSLTLINNAGVVEPIGPIDTVPAARIAGNIRLNLTALMVLSSAFIRLAEPYGCPKTILNISSGAGRHPYDGWGPYCAAKAGVDMFSRCLAAEQELREQPVRVVSIAPGVVDTEMQKRIREVDPSRFSRKDKFLRLKREDQLDSPERTAARLLDVLERGDLPGGPVADLPDSG